MIGRVRHASTGGERARHARGRHRRAAAVAVLLLALCFYIAFVKQLPFQNRFVVRAVFSSANQLKAGNPVRLSGLPVGSVTGVGPGPGRTSIVTLALSDHAGVHEDASLSIEPRLLFEGNFYVNLSPGSPAAPLLRSGQTIPLTQTSAPVQIDQVLDVLDAPTRAELSSTFSALAAGLGGNARQVPGYTGLHDAARQLAAALPPVAAVAAGLQGVAPNDLANAIGSSSDVTAQLAADPGALSDLVTSSAQVLAALGGGHGALARDIAGLDTLSRLAPATLASLHRALPMLTTFAHALKPALTLAPGALRDTNELFIQLRTLGSAPALPRLVTALAPFTRSAPALETELPAAFRLLTGLDICTSRNIAPALDTVIADGANTSGYPAWKDLLHLGAALSGASASFDGNGVALRIGLAEGDQTASGLIPGFGQLTGTYQHEGVRPEWLGYGVVPPFRPDQPCDRQPFAQVNR
jgi:virulence factor Mce-like protein